MNDHRLIEVDGCRLAIAADGVGDPPIVFVSPLGTVGEEWQPVADLLTAPPLVVTYDRPGLGHSDPLPTGRPERPHVMRHAALQLRELLASAGVAGPRVLVGHSIGGPLIEIYARLWPEEVAGLVFVDSTDLTLDLGRPIMADGDDQAYHFDLAASLAEQASAPPLPAVPAAVVTSAVGRWLRITDPDKYRPYTLDQVDARWQDGQRELAARADAVQLIAHTAGHDMPREAPALVAYAVDAVHTAAQTASADGQAVQLDAAAVATADGRIADRTGVPRWPGRTPSAWP